MPGVVPSPFTTGSTPASATTARGSRCTEHAREHGVSTVTTRATAAGSAATAAAIAPVAGRTGAAAVTTIAPIEARAAYSAATSGTSGTSGSSAHPVAVARLEPTAATVSHQYPTERGSATGAARHSIAVPALMGSPARRPTAHPASADNHVVVGAFGDRERAAPVLTTTTATTGSRGVSATATATTSTQEHRVRTHTRPGGTSRESH